MEEAQEKKREGEAKKTGELLQLVTFLIKEEEFAVDILNIQGINMMMDITKVPNSPDFVEGIINLRGQVIPVIDLRKRLKLAQIDFTKDSRIIVVEIEDKVVGFIVDKVKEVLRIDSSITEPPPPMVSGVGSEFITSVAKLEDRLITLLDLQKLLSLDDVTVLDEITA